MNDKITFPIPDPTRTNALKCLHGFVPKAGNAYTRLRNTDFGPTQHTNVSQLSPFIRHRLITEVEVLEAVLAHHPFANAVKFVHEVFWRCYFKGYLEARPEVWANYVSARNRLVESLMVNTKLASRYEAAISGQTGIDCFDAWVKELVETGYLHNHARMWFASIWIFTLKLPWELGADFTYRHFLDGDPASNTLSWRWVGGLHTKGKTYLARASNIAEFTNGRFSPKGLATDAPALNEAPMVRSTPRETIAINKASTGPATLLLTEEDLHPESLIAEQTDIQCVVGTQQASTRSPLPVSPLVTAFSTGAMKDGVTRAALYFNAKQDMLPQLTANDLTEMARKHELNTILTPYAPIGPIADQLAIIKPHLAEQGIALIMMKRREDQRIWPHCKKGFFEVKHHIPDILRDLAIQSE